MLASPGSTKSRPKTTTTNSARVRNCRLRYADAPSWTASAICFMLSVPSGAARTWRLSTTATTRDRAPTTAITPTMTRLVVPSSSIRPP